MTTTQPDLEIPRDRWGRPLIQPPEGGEAVPYTRTSTLAKTLDDLNMLMAWKQRKTAEGLVRRPDLLTRAAGVLANGNPDSDQKAKRDLNRICSEATEAAGASSGASSGTGLHALTEAVDRDQWPEFAPPADVPRLEAYRRATRDCGYTALDAEVFVVCDELRTAGTFDRLWRCPDGRVRIGDLKTGKSEADYPLSTCVQIATYAHGLRYDPATGDRSPIAEDLDLTVGLLVHMPATGGCQVVPLDLEKGWRVARMASVVHHEVRRWRAADIVREF